MEISLRRWNGLSAARSTVGDSKSGTIGRRGSLAFIGYLFTWWPPDFFRSSVRFFYEVNGAGSYFNQIRSRWRRGDTGILNHVGPRFREVEVVAYLHFAC